MFHLSKIPHIFQEDAWPFGIEQLLINGKLRAYELGKKFRQRYIKDLQFLNEKDYLHEIYVRSTDYDRTLMTAQCLLTGSVYHWDELIYRSFCYLNVTIVQPRDMNFRGKTNLTESIFL